MIARECPRCGSRANLTRETSKAGDFIKCACGYASTPTKPSADFNNLQRTESAVTAWNRSRG